MEFIYQYIIDLAKSGYLPEIFEHAFMVRGMLAACLST